MNPPPTGARAFGWLLLGAVISYAALLFALWIGCSRWASIGPAPSRIPPAERVEIIARLRAAVDGRAIPPGIAASEWTGFASIWCEGRLLVRAEIASHRGGALTGMETIANAEGLRARSDGERAACRVKVDVPNGRSPIVSSIDPLFALSLIPGVDGLGVDFGGRDVLVLPDELLAADVLAGYQPLRGVDFEMGVDTRGALRLLAVRAGADSDRWRRTPHHLFRFRSESFIEPASHTGPPLAVARASTPAPPLTRDSLRQAAIAAGDYLVRHLRAEGRFDYEYYTLSDQRTPDDGEYALPRHAGATWYLAQIYGATREPRFKEAAERALRYLVAHRPPGCDRPELACVGDEHADRVDTGSSAIALIAAVTYQSATGDMEFAPWIRRLAAFLLAMQKDDGDFCHLYEPRTGKRNEKVKLLYFSGEAAFALSKLAHVAADPRYVTAVDRALRFLTDTDYRPLARRFFFGEDHWTCLAVDDAWELLAPEGTIAGRNGYGDFCEAYGAQLRRQEFMPGDPAVRDQPDLVGAYGFTPLLPPHPTPIGSRSEAMISTWRVATKRGHFAEAAALKLQILASLEFLAERQIREDNAWLMPNPAAALGGLLMSDVKRNIRIDYLQHSGSALLRGAALLDEPHGN